MSTRPSPFVSFRGSGHVVVAAALLAASAGAIAGPKVIEISPAITTPDPTYSWPVSIAVDGDWLIATGRRDLEEQGPGFVDSSAWLYQRQSNGSWVLVRQLIQYVVPEDGDEPVMFVDMDGGVAAIIKENASWIFERSGSNWVEATSPISTDGMDVEVQGGTIVVSSGPCSWTANAYRKAANGAWTLVRQTLPGEPVVCENEDTRGDVDISGSSIIVATWSDTGINSARIFEGPFGGPMTQTTLVGTQERPVIGQPVAIEGTSALAASIPPHGIFAYARDSAGSWNPAGALLRPDGLALLGTDSTTIKVRSGLAVQNAPQDRTYGLRAGSVSVFQRNADGTYRYAARLIANNRGPERSFGRGVDISGRRVATSDRDSVYVFDVPTDLTENDLRQNNFEDGSASDWTQTTGSSFSVATTTTSRVFRQSSDVSNSAATLNGTDWGNQSIEADIKPTAYAAGSGDRWFGLVTRYTDANNYYYVTVRSTNIAQIKKIVNGVVTTIDTFGLPVTLNRSYRVRLEAIGTRLRLYVDNELYLNANDSSLSHGLAGVMMYRTKADYDNVLVSANPHTPLAIYRFGGDFDSWENWESVGNWFPASEGTNNSMYAQIDTTSGAHSIAGIPTDDQVVSVRMRRISAAGTNNWFGLATRFRDPANYYYITMRNNNVLSLRKLVNGAIVELDTAPFTATANRWYEVRFEAVRDQLRVYVDDALRLEAVDTSHPTGRYGPVMYRTSAQYDDLVAVQP